MGHPISYNCFISRKLLLKSGYLSHVTMSVAYTCLIYHGVLSQLDLILYKFIYITVRVRANGCENHVLTNFCLGYELVRDAVRFFRTLY